ncbi:Stk1 family PASTA domain-containing Ser/Thr kinase [Paenibacillus gallinarum]|uniref:non-specific serine/threonine protein kinase n=1 Tax=Paenibacillus gallinarum TaxID=2762232 RepID=A0ABR8SWH0_9BACL|nr:Stk1 family PASTA domain-containing Ser/Thr kinase [Paenibacillus gallinarum]MBD7967856.1 Stk1 family PASTA domain-containing Ser/Thr kinase [Paenibacillus gallinarum]
MIGHQLGGRYEVIERIGGGGMALVYKAQDILLNRNVAIKVLRQQFVHDEEFIRRFRREAQSAASLSHPNVVSIYDVGQEDEIHYIVMEYIEGQNLNEIIKERAPLQVEEAVRIACQIADALDHAHHNQIIHRDIKPHNILIGRNGRVKVTDFGIARAVTSTTITQTGSVVGSVHYFSPEHAKGVVTGEKSDLYSLGIVLYQMLTGQLPFLGESPISVALKHLQEDFEEPRLLNPLIPQSVENIILKSMRKDPNERYQSALEMQTDLETCLFPDRLEEPKMMFDDEFDIDQTRVIPAIKPEQYTAVNTDAAGIDPERADQKAKPNKKSKKRATFWVTLTLIVLVALAGVVFYVEKVLVVPNVPVPNVISLDEDAARKLLTESGLEVDEVSEKYKEGVDPGIVFEQSKPEGSLVKKGSLIDLTVGAEKPQEQMVDVTGENYEDAVQKLLALNIKNDNQIKKEESFSDEVVGTVISQSIAPGAEFDPDTAEIVLTVSKGPELILMPDLINKSRSEAEKLIKDNNLKLAEVKEESSFQVEKGKVTQQWPVDAGSSIAPGTEITIYVSTGYSPETIEYTFTFPIAPSEEGTNNKIRIVYTDARGENQEWGTKTINKVQTFSVPLVLAPNRDGYVTVHRDGILDDTYKVGYFDAKNGNVEIPEIKSNSEPEEGGGGDEGPGTPAKEPEKDTTANHNNGNGNGNDNGKENNSEKNDNKGNNGENGNDKNDDQGNGQGDEDPSDNEDGDE